MSQKKELFLLNAIRQKQLLVFLFFLIPIIAPVALSEVMPADEALLQEIQYLRQLKQDDPAAYKNLIDQKKNQIKRDITSFNSQDRSRFSSYAGKNQENRRRRIEMIRDKDPERFHEFKQRRMERFQRFQTENPEKFQRFAEKHPHLKEKMEQRQLKRENLQLGQKDHFVSKGSRDQRRRQPRNEELQSREFASPQFSHSRQGQSRPQFVRGENQDFSRAKRTFEDRGRRMDRQPRDNDHRRRP